MKPRPKGTTVLPVLSRRDLEAHVRDALQLWRERADLQKAFPDPRSAEYWFWVQWHGIADYVGRETGSFATPSPTLLSRVVGDTTPLAFHQGGLVDWRRIHGCLVNAGFRFESAGGDGGGDLLDFGCGCGRILRFFGYCVATCRLYGVDVDGDAIDWCRRHLQFASFETITRTPSLPHPDASFDAIYAFSIFSHLPESVHLGWLRELRRVARPGCILVVTVQGRRILSLARDGSRPDVMPNVTDRATAAARAEESGFLFLPYSSVDAMDLLSRQFFQEWDLDAYGSTFILEPYVRENWGQFFEIMSFIESPDGWQDYVILRRP